MGTSKFRSIVLNIFSLTPAGGSVESPRSTLEYGSWGSEHPAPGSDVIDDGLCERLADAMNDSPSQNQMGSGQGGNCFL